MKIRGVCEKRAMGILLSFGHSLSVPATQERRKVDEALIKMHLSSFSPGLPFSHTGSRRARCVTLHARRPRVRRN